MREFCLKSTGPEIWEIVLDGKQVGELRCSWSHGYDARFMNEEPAMVMEFWKWMSTRRAAPPEVKRYKWL